MHVGKWGGGGDWERYCRKRGKEGEDRKGWRVGVEGKEKWSEDIL